MMLQYAVFNKTNNAFWNGFFTVSQLAASHKFPSNVDEFYEFVPVSGLFDADDLPIVEGDILEWNGDKFTATFTAGKWIGVQDFTNKTRGHLPPENFSEAFLLGNSRSNSTFIRE